jgi:hypothetical protein
LLQFVDSAEDVSLLRDSGLVLDFTWDLLD